MSNSDPDYVQFDSLRGRFALLRAWLDCAQRIDRDPAQGTQLSASLNLPEKAALGVDLAYSEMSEFFLTKNTDTAV